MEWPVIVLELPRTPYTRKTDDEGPVWSQAPQKAGLFIYIYRHVKAAAASMGHLC